MPPADGPIRTLDSDEVIEANIAEARLNNEYERTLTTEAPEGPPPIRATEVPRDTDHRERDVTPTAYRHPEDREPELTEVAFGPFVGPINGEGADTAAQQEAMRSSATGGRHDEHGNLLMDPGTLPGQRRELPGHRDDDGNLIADHDGDGIAAAKEGPIREAIGAGVSPKASEEDQHGSRSLDDEDRDLNVEADREVAPEHDPDASEEEQKGGRGVDDRDLGDAEDEGQLPEHSEFLSDAEVSDEAAAVATTSRPPGAEAVAAGVVPEVRAEDVQPPDLSHPAGGDAGDSEASPGPGDRTKPREDASAGEWREYARRNGVEVSDSSNKAQIKSALREAGLIR